MELDQLPMTTDIAKLAFELNAVLVAANTSFILQGDPAGSNGEVRPGDVCSIAPGHDAWTVGDEACVTIDFGGIEQYDKR